MVIPTAVKDRVALEVLRDEILRLRGVLVEVRHTLNGAQVIPRYALMDLIDAALAERESLQ